MDKEKPSNKSARIFIELAVTKESLKGITAKEIKEFLYEAGGTIFRGLDSEFPCEPSDLKVTLKR